MTDDAQDVLWGLRNVTTGKLMLEVFRTEVAAELAAARHTNRWRKVEALALAPLATLVEEVQAQSRLITALDETLAELDVDHHADQVAAEAWPNVPVETAIPEPPWAVSAATNCKRAGWCGFFESVEREACPFPKGRGDLQRGWRDGWDAACVWAGHNS